MKHGWPKETGHVETSQRVRGALQLKRKSAIDVRRIANEQLRSLPKVAGKSKTVSIAFVYKIMRGVAARTDRGKAVRAAIEKLTGQKCYWLFQPADEANALLLYRKRQRAGVKK